MPKFDKTEYYYPDGIVKVERWTLYREGFTPIKVRWMLGEYEVLSYTSANGDERWSKIDMPDEQIEAQIDKYCKE